MAGHTTKPYRNTFSGSVGAGMGSLFSPNGRKYYILEHKVSSKYHRAGESQEIIVDNIELGRDSHCQVRFDESFQTVSRHHAGIVRDGDMWKLVQISKVNTTFLNGRPVKTEWYLQNGDEIQLSVNGPKLGFIVPTGKKSTVGSIGLTRRLSLFRQQALRPYKTAIAALACILVLVCMGGGYIMYDQSQQIKDNAALLAKAQNENMRNKELIEQQNKMLQNQSGVLDSLKKRKSTTVVKYVNNGGGRKPAPIPNPVPVPPTVDMSSCYPYVYYVEIFYVLNGKEFSAGSGTGFQLDDGRFFTARHIGRSVYFPATYGIGKDGITFYSDSYEDIYDDMYLNLMYQTGKLKLKFKCISVSDSFTFTCSQIKDNGQSDRIVTLDKAFPLMVKDNETGNWKQKTYDDGSPMAIPAGVNLRIARMDDTDWIYVQRNTSKGLKSNASLSSSLKQGTQLYILGYPEGWAKGQEPILSTAMCSQNGLSKDFGNTIMASNGNTTGGNSGGPVFIKEGNSWAVVALVSGSKGTRSYSKKGTFVPLSAAR